MVGQIFEFLFHVRKSIFFWCEIFQKSPKNFNGSSHSKLPAPPGSGSRFWRFFTIFMNFRREKCFFNLSGPISMRNFTGNPFLMVSERYGNAKFVKSRKNQKKIAKLDFPVNPLSRSSPDATVGTPLPRAGTNRCPLDWGATLHGGDPAIPPVKCRTCWTLDFPH